MGDDTRIALIDKIAKAGGSEVVRSGDISSAEVRVGTTSLQLSVSANPSLAGQCHLAWQSDLTLIACDATIGPHPIVREHVVAARQKHAPATIFALTNCASIEDPELLELEELELGELLMKYGSKGDRPQCVRDHKVSSNSNLHSSAQGASEIAAFLARFTSSRVQDTSEAKPSATRAKIYVFVPQETNPPGLLGRVESGSCTVVMNGDEINTTIDTEMPIGPGETGQCNVTFPVGQSAQVGRRFLIVRDNHIVAVGFLVQPN